MSNQNSVPVVNSVKFCDLLINYSQLNDLLREYGLSCVTLGEAQELGLTYKSKPSDIQDIVAGQIHQLESDISAMKAEGIWF